MESLKVRLAVVCTASLMYAIGMMLLGFLINTRIIDPVNAGGLLSVVSICFAVFLLINIAFSPDPQNAKEDTPAVVSKE